MKTTITRSELKDIHTIACSDWKSKIEKYASKNPFSETIEFTEKQVEEMISASTAEQLPIVKKIFDIKDITAEIQTVEDAITKLGEKDEEVILLKRMEGLPQHIISEQEMIVIVKALNEKYVLDWDNSKEYKYFPWFYLGKDFRYYFYYTYCTYSHSSSRLALKNKELAIYAGNQFTEIYKKFMN